MPVGTAGALCDDGEVCNGVTCALSCPPGFIDCNGTCIDPLTSRTHCAASLGCGVTGGSSGLLCPDGRLCNGTSCALTCQPGLIACIGKCIDPTTNRTNCGATLGCGATGGIAGDVCDDGELCNAGDCALSCQVGLVDCGGTCVDPRTSRTYCGATAGCGGAMGGTSGALCPAGQVCNNGTGCTASCPMGRINCGGTCVDPSSNPTYCGATAGCGVTGGDDGSTCGTDEACFMGTCLPLAEPIPTFLWLDASDATSITKDGSNNVTQWRDKSGLGRHATPFGSAPVWTAGVTPNGQPAIQFAASPASLKTANVLTVSNMTIFVVFQMNAPETWGSILNQSHDAFFSIRKSDCCGGNGNLNFHIQNNNGAPLLPITTGAWRLLTAVRNGSTSSMFYRSGGSSSFVGDTLTAGSPQPVTLGNSIGGGQSMGGYIAEIRAFSDALSPSERSLVESSLAGKYGLP